MNIYIHSYDNPDNPGYYSRLIHSSANPDSCGIYIYIYIGEDDIRKVMTSTLGPEVNNPNNPNNPTNFLGMTVIGLSPT